MSRARLARVPALVGRRGIGLEWGASPLAPTLMSPLPPPPPVAAPALDPHAGLSEAQARERLARFGPNTLEGHEKQGLLQTLRSVATEPMFLLLLLAAAVYLVLGDLGEGLLLSFFALLTVGLVILQERRSAHALDALRSLAVPQVRVLRDGHWQRRPASALVPGDLVAVAEGDRVAADGRLVEAMALMADESLLSGESVPVRKRALVEGEAAGEAGAAVQPGGEDSPWLYAGTLLVSGHGLLQLAATGGHTQLGRIGASLARIDTGITPLQQQLRRVVQVFGALALCTSLLLLLWHGWRDGAWLQGLLAGIAIGMAMLPEEFPMALTVFLALGAWRLARIQVLARRPAVIEALGAATLLCVDKTGTLTENRMSLRRLCSPALDLTLDAPPRPGEPLPEAVHRLLAFGVLASRRGGADPMDQALLQLGDAALAGTDLLHPDWTLVHEYPLSPALLAFSQVWAAPDGSRWVAVKGAPEAVADLCHLEPEAWQALHARVQAMAEAGLRVLAVAAGPVAPGQVPALVHDHGFEWEGLLGYEDPLRASVPAAVAQARQAGVAVAMITGDHASTALAIARQAGIAVQGGVLTGEQLAGLDDAALDQALRRVRVFARVMPEQKLRLVLAFQRLGETVAMTGDGVNDAPALKAAHVGIAMGVRGTDVAREAAGLVLLDEDFGRIVGGIRMGRRIFDNLRRVMAYIVAIHVPIAGLALLPVLFGLPPLLLPAHVVLTEMVIDPICSLAFEGAPEHPRLMQRPPRSRGEGLLAPRLLTLALGQGAILLLAALGLYAWALDLGRSTDQARTLAMLALTLGNLALVGLDLSLGLGWRSLLAPAARSFWAVAAAATLVLGGALWLPELRRLLHFELLPWGDAGRLLAIMAGALALAGWLTARQQAREAASPQLS